jgi:hypothetical protein
MVTTIEPVLSVRSQVVAEWPEGGVLLRARGSYSAQLEHTAIITRGDPINLTQH